MRDLSKQPDLIRLTFRIDVKRNAGLRPATGSILWAINATPSRLFRSATYRAVSATRSVEEMAGAGWQPSGGREDRTGHYSELEVTHSHLSIYRHVSDGAINPIGDAR